jgi:hypothetical protein
MMPDHQALHADRYKLGESNHTIVLTPSGFLVGVTVDLASYGTEEALHFELTDIDCIGLYGEFVVRSGFGFHQGGTLLQALPNFNAAMPYVLRVIEKDHPEIKVTALSVWPVT